VFPYQGHAFSDVFWRCANAFFACCLVNAVRFKFVSHIIIVQDMSLIGHHPKINVPGFPTSLEPSFVDICSLNMLFRVRSYYVYLHNTSPVRYFSRIT
jgi:hypothetical protein